MNDPRDDADESGTRAAAPPAGSGELPRLGPSGGPTWVNEDASGQTGWVEARGGKPAWVDKQKSQEDWVASAGTSSSEETVTMDPPDAGLGARRRLGDFELERKVGQGGMGEVWLARQISLDRPVAVKVLPRSLANQENFIERFQREAKAAASLVHPNVLQIYSFGVSEGTPYFAMEFVEGEDLQQRMRRGPIEWAEIARIMIGVGSALAAAHEKGLIHRDIKPSNIMIDRLGQVKVMDFGLAKATTSGNKSLTSAGLIMGTPNYLSPEQGRGDPLDGRSDLYSLGVVLYELITGQLPFRADTPAGLIFKHVYEPPPPPLELNPEAPAFLVEICLKLLEKDPDDRYASANEFLADITEFFDEVDHYVQGGSRRPGAGAEDQERVQNSGAYASASLARRRPVERNSATEEITRPNRRLDDEDPSPAPARRSERAPAATDDAEPKRPRSTGTRRPPLPRRRSRWPVVLLLLVAALGGGAYAAWTFYPEQVRALAQRYGVQLPGVALVTTGTGAGTSTTTTTTTTPRTGTEVVAIPDGEPVSYTLEPGVLPPGVTAALEVPGHRYELRPNEEGRYRVGDYTLELNKRGYQPERFPVRLVKGEDKRGVLLDDAGRDAIRISPSWDPVPELAEAYTAALSARAQGKLQVALADLQRAARLDPEYRPRSEEEEAKSVQELIDEVQGAIREAEQAATTLQTELEIVRGLMDERRWRSARDLLIKLQSKLPEGDQRKEVEVQLGRCDAEARGGDALLAAVETAIASGAHVAAAGKIQELRQADPEHPDLGKVEGRLGDARRLREAAMAPPGDDLIAAVARLKNYVDTFGPRDVDAQRRLDELTRELKVREDRAKRLAALRQAAQERRWIEARRLALEILGEDTDNVEAQRIRSQAEAEMSRQGIADTLAGIDQALVKGSLDDAIRLLDPESPSYAIERATFVELSQVKARFTSSQHKDLQIRVEGEHAVVLATWEFAIEVLGQAPTSMAAQHRVRLRRVNGGRWLVTEFQVEGEPSAQKR